MTNKEILGLTAEVVQKQDALALAALADCFREEGMEREATRLLRHVPVKVECSSEWDPCVEDDDLPPYGWTMMFGTDWLINLWATPVVLDAIVVGYVMPDYDVRFYHTMLAQDARPHLHPDSQYPVRETVKNRKMFKVEITTIELWRLLSWGRRDVREWLIAQQQVRDEYK